MTFSQTILRCQSRTELLGRSRSRLPVVEESALTAETLRDRHSNVLLLATSHMRACHLSHSSQECVRLRDRHDQEHVLSTLRLGLRDAAHLCCEVSMLDDVDEPRERVTDEHFENATTEEVLASAMTCELVDRCDNLAEADIGDDLGCECTHLGAVIEGGLNEGRGLNSGGVDQVGDVVLVGDLIDGEVPQDVLDRIPVCARHAILVQRILALVLVTCVEHN
jgi:hypothetical protein